MTLPCLLLQKPSRNNKAKDHVKNTGRKLEARTIQHRFRNSANSRRTHDDSARSFAKLMWEGKVSAALKM